MAVLSMKKISIAAMKRDRKELIEYLQFKNVMEIETKHLDETKDMGLTITDHGEDIGKITRYMEQVDEARKILEDYSDTEKPALAFLQGKESKPVSEYYVFEDKADELLTISTDIVGNNNWLARTRDNISALDVLDKELELWKNMDLPLNYSGTKTTQSYLGSVSGNYSLQELQDCVKELMLEQLEQNEQDDSEEYPFHIDIISTTREQTNILATCRKEDAVRFKTLIDMLDFVYPNVRSRLKPSQLMENHNAERRELNRNVEEYIDRLEKRTKYQEEMDFLYDYLAIEKDKLAAYSRLMESKQTIFLEGYILERESENLKKDLTDKFVCAVNITPVPQDEEAPIQLENSWFTEPVEGVVTGFGYPGPGEVDPTAVTSIFYYVMFGLMFSDAGYGFILAAACAFCLIKFKNMDRGLNKTIRMFFWCGVSTVFWGIIFSSYFGDVVDVVSSHFFGKPLTIPPVWFAPLDNPMKLLIFCLGIGTVHLITGYIMNGYTSFKNGDYPAILYDAGFPLMFLAGVLAVFMTTDMFESMSGFMISLSPTVQNVFIGLAGIACVGTILTGGRESASWFKRILKGIFALYNLIAGWLSDILSYSRLLALGLATGVIGSVVNSLGSMTGTGIVGAILFVLVFAFGHSLNFGINILGSYVHSNRLEYVEFYGKFFDGGGRAFTPLAANTKFYKFKEEI